METITDAMSKKAGFTVPSLVSRESRPGGTVVNVGGVEIGGKKIVVIAGPCSVESRAQIFETARGVKLGGAKMLRGGAFKPRTSPYSFQGLGSEGLELLAETRMETGLPVVTEVMDTRQVELVSEYADMLQVGSRNMQNIPLLREVGAAKKPVLLKRGLMSTVEEFLNAAEYILAAGNSQIVLCERGIRTFETSTRNTLDLNTVAMLKELTHLPVIVDPSHGTGVGWLVAPMTRAALAAGADGIIMEVHYRPQEALSDGYQSLNITEFGNMMLTLAPLAAALGREL